MNIIQRLKNWNLIINRKGYNSRKNKREKIFQQLLFTINIYVISLFIIICFAGYYVIHQFGESYYPQVWFYIYTTFVLMVSLLSIFFLYRRYPFIALKIASYIIGISYVTLLCVFSGKESGIIIVLFGLLPLPFFVLDFSERKWLYTGLVFNVFAIGVSFYWNKFHEPIFDIPGQFSLIISILSIIYNLFIIIIMTNQLWRESNYYEIKLEIEQRKSQDLLLNILPEEIVRELKTLGSAKPKYFSSVTVLFTDFEGFTKFAEVMSPEEIVFELDQCFSFFDSLMDKYNLEKLKTIGDSYMCAGGIPQTNETHAIDCVNAAMEIRDFMEKKKKEKEKEGKTYWNLRLGIHTGPLVAGVIGEKKFAYDVWGDTVNTASRMESSGVAGKINISSSTYELVKQKFNCEYRGKVKAKNKGEVDMYFVV